MHALGNKNRPDIDSGAESLFNKIRTFDSDKSARFSRRLRERFAQLFQAAILLTLYNANRHAIESWAYQPIL
jgi:hypothetical protein